MIASSRPAESSTTRVCSTVRVALLLLTLSLAWLAPPEAHAQPPEADAGVPPYPYPPPGPAPPYPQAPPPQDHPAYGYPPYGPPQGYPPQPYPPQPYPPQPYPPQPYAPYGYPPPPYPQQPQIGPAVMDYEEGEPVPRGYEVKSHTSYRTAAIGGAVFLLGYLPAVYAGLLLSAAESFTADGDDYVPLYIPAAGPFITIGTAHASVHGGFWLVLMGATQSAGLITGAVGLLSASEQRLHRIGSTLTVAPIIAAGRLSGLGVSGSF